MNQPSVASETGIALRNATLDDLPLLAEMNWQLIRDEGAPTVYRPFTHR